VWAVQTRFRIVSPGLTGSRSGPEDWARRWAQFAPFVNCMEGVKGFAVDIGVVIIAGVDSDGVNGVRKL
jgi:hypothetical protein